ncbi:hypothetical protein ACFOVU_19455 [Nocardiopsis sediminis]|uniref:Uncharacterized protein n=1 Tax=Nocardiopsis sediminis TaxID=1778267 RepID=A0ABV8FTY0_9ACTN
MNIQAALGLAARACPADVSEDTWDTCGNTLLGWIMGLGVVIAIIAILIIAGKMIQANFTGDPWIAARGMGELPWVTLGIVLLLVAAPLVALLFSGAEVEEEQSVWQVYLEENVPEPSPRDTGDPSDGPTDDSRPV